MWWRAETHSLTRVSERVSTIYVEQCLVRRDDNAVVLTDEGITDRFQSFIRPDILDKRAIPALEVNRITPFMLWNAPRGVDVGMLFAASMVRNGFPLLT